LIRVKDSLVIELVAHPIVPVDVRLAASERIRNMATGVIAHPIHGKAAIEASIVTPNGSVA
jgi:hypothetical protein